MRKQTKTKKKVEEYYHNDVEYLEDQFRLIDIMLQRKDFAQFEEDYGAKSLIDDLDKKIAEKKQAIEHKKLIAGEHDISFHIDTIIQDYKLDDTEGRILFFLLYRYFTTDNEGATGRIILGHATDNRLSMMQARHYLMENEKLRQNHIIQCEDEEEYCSVLDLEFNLPEEIIPQILGEQQTSVRHELKNSTEKNYRNYINLYFTLVELMERKAELLSILRHETAVDALGFLDYSLPQDNTKELSRIRHSIRKTKASIDEFGDVKNNYPIEQVTKEYQLSWEEKIILVILLQDSLGLSVDSFGGECEGKRLLAIISDSENEMIARRSLLYKDGNLRKHKLIDVENSSFGQNILDGEYYLSEAMIRRLLGDLKDTNKDASLADEDIQLEEENRNLLIVTPRFSFCDVILDESKKNLIEVAISQQKNHSLIFETWGFGKKIPYGHSITMLFSGPPGTGKTMMAEAVAHSLDKKLLIANYSQIQNMYVGETEKRIVATFKKAQELGGVLLWDEADGMFYSRDMAVHSWEHRDINVILQELERFSGVVILTTNRSVNLDVALERRIAVKMTFDMPGFEQRIQIWKSLIPAEAPLSANVHLEEFASKYELSGGSIKNAILHAARYAAYRHSNTITQEDFLEGVKMEMEGSWTNASKIGFQKIKSKNIS